MNAGKLRHRVTLQTINTTDDDDGYPEPDWTAVKANIPAWVREVSGQEGTRGRQVDATTTHLLTARYNSEVNAQRRFLWGTRILNIVRATDETGRKREQTIECREAV